jgi:hypothetical protein
MADELPLKHGNVKNGLVSMIYSKILLIMFMFLHEYLPCPMPPRVLHILFLVFHKDQITAALPALINLH